MEMLRQLGMLERFLKRPHDEVRTLTARVADRADHDRGHLPPAGAKPFIALMPQWDFLDFLAEEARPIPGSTSDGGRSRRSGPRKRPRRGVRLKDGEEVRARLTIAADGRSSILREKAGLPKKDLGAPIDVLWFRLPKEKTPDQRDRRARSARDARRRDRPRRLLAVRLCRPEGRRGRDQAEGHRCVPQRCRAGRAGARRLIERYRTGIR